MSQNVFFVGAPSEVKHHAAPLDGKVAYEIVSPDRICQRAQRGDLAIFFSEHFDRFRQSLWTLKQNGVGTLYMIDGILEWRNAWENRDDEPACPWTMRPALAHKIACIGPVQQTLLNSWGNTSKTELVGIPRFDSLAPQPIRAISSPVTKFRLLVMSAKCPGFTHQQIERTVESFRDLKEWLGTNTKDPCLGDRDVEIVWRLTGDLAKRIDVENHCDDLSGKELAEIIGSVDAVITTPSTAMLESMRLGRPVAILDYHNTPQLNPAAWTISAQSQISSVISELVQPSAAKVGYQQFAMNAALLATHDATSRMSILIERMLSHMASSANDVAAPNEGIQFPPNMLGDLPVEPPLEFHHQQLYSSYPEFKEADTIELQTQLAHSRREIVHLQRELAQLQSELSVAHGIFEQIHRHPIAGPVVRVRQRLIDWMKRFRVRASAASPDSMKTSSSASTTP